MLPTVSKLSRILSKLSPTQAELASADPLELFPTTGEASETVSITYKLSVKNLEASPTHQDMSRIVADISAAGIDTCPEIFAGACDSDSNTSGKIKTNCQKFIGKQVLPMVVQVSPTPPNLCIDDM